MMFQKKTLVLIRIIMLLRLYALMVKSHKLKNKKSFIASIISGEIIKKLLINDKSLN